MTRDEEYAIGIDLGTTNSCVAVWQYGRGHVIQNEQGYNKTPSCVAFTDSYQLVGVAAKNQIVVNPTNTIYDAKRLIGSRFSDEAVQREIKLLPFEVMAGPGDKPLIRVKYKGAEKRFTPEEISSMIVRKMKEIAEAYLGTPVQKAVITVPAYFDQSQRLATKEAGRRAGLKVLDLMDEPMAAALAYSRQRKVFLRGKRNLLIINWGESTFDVSLLTIEEGNRIMVKAVGGDTHLGGEAIDKRMVELCAQHFNKKIWWMDVTKDPKALAILKIKCEEAKKDLSSKTHTRIIVACLHKGADFFMPISRAKLEELSMDIFRRCMDILEKFLADNGVAKDRVDDVVLVGGSCRIPKLQQMLEEFFSGKKLCNSIYMDEAVAYGAAVQAAKLKLIDKSDVTPLSLGSSSSGAANLAGEGREAIPDLRLVDVTPFSPGGIEMIEVLTVLIQKNTAIPATAEKIFSTVKKNQTGIHMKVYKIRSFEKNQLAEINISLSGIPPTIHRVQKIIVCFDTDSSGILNVSARATSTGINNHIMIADDKRRLSDEEIDKMLEDAEEYKVKALENHTYSLRDKVNQGRTILPFQGVKKMGEAIAETKQWLAGNKLAELNAYLEKKASQAESVSGNQVLRANTAQGKG